VDTGLFSRLVLNVSRRLEGQKHRSINYNEFKKIFEGMPGWEGHFAPETPLDHILKNPFIYLSNHDLPNEISTSRLIFIGILLCKGNARLRAEVLWTVIQEGDQTFLSACDKDF